MFSGILSQISSIFPKSPIPSKTAQSHTKSVAASIKRPLMDQHGSEDDGDDKENIQLNTSRIVHPTTDHPPPHGSKDNKSRPSTLVSSSLHLSSSLSQSYHPLQPHESQQSDLSRSLTGPSEGIFTSCNNRDEILQDVSTSLIPGSSLGNNHENDDDDDDDDGDNVDDMQIVCVDDHRSYPPLPSSDALPSSLHPYQSIESGHDNQRLKKRPIGSPVRLMHLGFVDYSLSTHPVEPSCSSYSDTETEDHHPAHGNSMDSDFDENIPRATPATYHDHTEQQETMSVHSYVYGRSLSPASSMNLNETLCGANSGVNMPTTMVHLTHINPTPSHDTHCNQHDEKRSSHHHTTHATTISLLSIEDVDRSTTDVFRTRFPHLYALRKYEQQSKVIEFKSTHGVPCTDDYHLLDKLTTMLSSCTQRIISCKQKANDTCTQRRWPRRQASLPSVTMMEPPRWPLIPKQSSNDDTTTPLPCKTDDHQSDIDTDSDSDSDGFFEIDLIPHQQPICSDVNNSTPTSKHHHHSEVFAIDLSAPSNRNVNPRRIIPFQEYINDSKQQYDELQERMPDLLTRLKKEHNRKIQQKCHLHSLHQHSRDDTRNGIDRLRSGDQMDQAKDSIHHECHTRQTPQSKSSASHQSKPIHGCKPSINPDRTPDKNASHVSTTQNTSTQPSYQSNKVIHVAKKPKQIQTNHTKSPIVKLTSQSNHKSKPSTIHKKMNHVAPTPDKTDKTRFKPTNTPIKPKPHHHRHHHHHHRTKKDGNVNKHPKKRNVKEAGISPVKPHKLSNESQTPSRKNPKKRKINQTPQLKHRK